MFGARAAKHLYRSNIDHFHLSIALSGFFCFNGVLLKFPTSSILVSVSFVRMSHDWHNLFLFVIVFFIISGFGRTE